MRYFVSVFCLILLVSCSRSKEGSVFLSADLKDYIVDTLYLEKDTLTKNLPVEFVLLEENGRHNLYGIVGSKLFKYNYQTGELISSLTFEREGPDGIGSFVSGNLVTEEGIFFISDQKHIIQTDFQGQVLERYPLPEVSEERLGSNFTTMNGNRMLYDNKNKTLIFSDVPFVLKAPNMEYENWVWKYDLAKREVEPLKFLYPIVYLEHFDDPELGIYSHAYAITDKIHVLSFPVTDSLLVIENNSSRWVKSKSSEKMVFQRGFTEQRGELTVFSPSMETSRYKWVLHDPYRELWLRYTNIETKEGGESKYVNKSSFIIHNKGLEVIGEVFFDNQKISPTGFFTKEGFYLKLLDPSSEDYEKYVRVRLEL
ncbi:MAG: DUF4221 domain-containing protein [Mongoliibacter sp.]|uniref:DUF4221 family protein n=1 Tax=Mongoliibacter sp. TaxID=2022438 RepID=UPI0012EF5CA5|nr:DUF4221 family protein [Mongoliibacter sp.]TVP54083.1 MAG: DUF4221 domain-containing protein [Mongoliibacter sp.]